MKLLTKTLCAFLTTVASISALSTNAIAGEGGAAGSAAFTINSSSQVTGVAVSAAVGKQDAFAGAFNASGALGGFDENNIEINTAFAQGSAGVITVLGVTPMGISTIQSNPDPGLTTVQNNTFNSATTVQLGTNSGNSVVQIGESSANPI